MTALIMASSCNALVPSESVHLTAPLVFCHVVWLLTLTDYTQLKIQRSNKAKRCRPRGARDDGLLLLSAFLRLIIFCFQISRGWETKTALRQCENNVSFDRCQAIFCNLELFLYQKMTEDSSTLNQLQEELKAADEVCIQHKTKT